MFAPRGVYQRGQLVRTSPHRYPRCSVLTHPREYSTITDTDCILLGLSQQHFADLVNANHLVALEVQRLILTRAAIRRNKLEREMFAMSDVQRESMHSTRLGQMRGYRMQLR